MMLALVATVAAAGAAYFTVRFIQLWRGYSALSQVERRRAEVLATRESTGTVTRLQAIRLEFARLGLGRDLFPLLAAFATSFLVVAAPLSIALPVWMALLAAIPGAGAVAWFAVGFNARRRRSAFNRQLIDLLDLTVSQIKGGVGAERALHIVVPQLPNPVREEMAAALAAGQAGKDLVSAMRELGERYPSKAFEMFLAALEIDRAEGHAIAPALDQAAELLKQEFTLAAEANSALAQVKYEFYAVAAIVVGIASYLILGGEKEFREAYSSPMGLIVLALAAGNMGLGFFRFNRKIKSVTGDTK